jgi:predicted RNase H-like HicB family nuclease
MDTPQTSSIIIKDRNESNNSDSMKKELKEYDVVIEKDEQGVFVAYIPEIPGCHTQGNSIAEAMANIKEAAELCLEYASEKAEGAMKFVAVKKVTLPRPALS